MEKLLKELADKLGTTTEYLWAVLIKQAGLYFYFDLAWIVFTMIFWTITVLLHLRFIKNNTYDDRGNILPPTIMAFMIVLCFIFFICDFFAFTEMLTAKINPEYFALEKILNLIGKK